MNRPNLLAGVLCLGGVGLLAAAFGPGVLTAGVGSAAFAALLGLAGVLFLAAATGGTVDVGGRTVDVHDCSGLGDVTVGLALLGGLASPPAGVEGVVYAALVVTGATSAVLFGVVGLAEKYGWL
ncbi:hypothetical protein [Haloarcula litorea]|uniref:hypothetical protein n=1 Tax=Haloarcula litorea TaxID=3032579 RepID=UPI0023E8C69B|nr:hypothetical protein [Halomicroarcula sp. GDY20]